MAAPSEAVPSFTPHPTQMFPLLSKNEKPGVGNFDYAIKRIEAVFQEEQLQNSCCYCCLSLRLSKMKISEISEGSKEELKKILQADLTVKTGLESHIFRYSPLGIALYDSAWQLIDCNPSYFGILGYEREDLIGLPYTKIINKDELDKVRKKVVTNADGVSYEQYKANCLRKDGTYAWCKFSISAIFNTDEEKVCYVVQLYDLTYYKKFIETQKQALENNKMLMTVMHSELIKLKGYPKTKKINQ